MTGVEGSHHFSGLVPAEQSTWPLFGPSIGTNCCTSTNGSEGVVRMQTGTVTRLFEVRGFGFISPDASDRDVFLGMDVIDQSIIPLHEGQRVEFEAIDAMPGLKATMVKPLPS